MKPTNFRTPKTDRKLRVQFRNGRTSLHTYGREQLRWTDTGSEWDIIAAEYAEKREPRGDRHA